VAEIASQPLYFLIRRRLFDLRNLKGMVRC
jgi:hypothetical protein